MAVSVSCPGCATTISVSEDLLGNKLRCKSCKEMFVASAAKVAAGVKGKEERIQVKPSVPSARTNGQPVRGTTISRAGASAKPEGGNGKMLAMIGGGAFAIMAGVTLWALFGRGGNDAKPTVPPIAGTSKGGLNLNDPVAPEIVDQPETKAKPVEVAAKPAMKKSGPATFAQAPANLPYEIPESVVEHVKKSAVFIFVGGGSGSGWFAEPGIVVTNSHVVGMKDPISPPPKSLKLILDAGVPGKQREIPGELLGLDRENDLAVIRAIGENLPDPIPIAPSSEIVEGQRLYSIGFPRGNQIVRMFDEGKNELITTVKSRQTTVSGRLPTEHGSIKLLQIEAGTDPGNSGSMIVCPAGYVRLIHVMGKGYALKFSIPSEYAVYLLQGRILKVVPSQPYEADGKVLQPLTAFVADPMKRIKRVSLELWTGEPGKKIRPAATSQPSPNPGDSPRQIVSLAYDPNTKVALGESVEAKGVCELPTLKDGQVYWLQPHYVDFEGNDRWGEAVALEMGGQPVVRKPAMLSLMNKVGAERKVELDSLVGVGATPEGHSVPLDDNGMKLKLTEKVVAVQPDGSAKLQLKYDDITMTDEDMQFRLQHMARGVLEAARGMVTDLVVTKRGFIRSPNTNMKNVPIPVRPYLERFNMQTIQSLEALSMALPDREVQPGETWKHDLNFAVTVPPKITENALFQMTYRYVGTRVREGREEAVIEYEGKIVRGEGNEIPKPPPPATKGGKGEPKDQPILTRGMHGVARGAATLDLKTGLVSLARTYAETEFHVSYGSQNISFGAEMRIDLRRQVVAGQSPGIPAKHLPNQELILNPFVGAPDLKLSSMPRRSANWFDPIAALTLRK